MIDWMKQNPGYTFLIIFFGYVMIENCVEKIFNRNKSDGDVE